MDQSNELGVCLELVQAYLGGARRQAQAGPLVEVLERAVEARVRYRGMPERQGEPES